MWGTMARIENFEWDFFCLFFPRKIERVWKKLCRVCNSSRNNIALEIEFASEFPIAGIFLSNYQFPSARNKCWIGGKFAIRFLFCFCVAIISQIFAERSRLSIDHHMPMVFVATKGPTNVWLFIAKLSKIPNAVCGRLHGSKYGQMFERKHIIKFRSYIIQFIVCVRSICRRLKQFIRSQCSCTQYTLVNSIFAKCSNQIQLHTI